ncbi:ribose 5-phosphate epimerase [Theileria orientalis]|uniref:ribose-5-phosphate isomerase n=1 Tax=Theileria orientalis TaxID=68886 RepID=A0A976SIT9_THEOR|nr:ribose 5-phosphate epimerase [Theileria orientalis]
MDQVKLMKLVAHKAVDTYVKSNTIVALGTGRTSGFAVERLAELLKQEKLTNVLGVSTSNRTSKQANELGIPLLTLDEVVESDRLIDVAIDGADSIDQNLNMIKGGGGALFREFLVEQYAKEFVVMVDQSKVATKHLLDTFDLPIEIVENGHRSTCKYIFNKFKDYINDWKVRRNTDGSVFLTDNHNVVMDVNFKPLELEPLHRELKMIHGVVCSGLFLNIATKCLVARDDNTVYTMERPYH